MYSSAFYYTILVLPKKRDQNDTVRKVISSNKLAQTHIINYNILHPIFN